MPANRPQPISGFQPAHGPPSGPPLAYCILPTHSTTAGFSSVPGIPPTYGPVPTHQASSAPLQPYDPPSTHRKTAGFLPVPGIPLTDGPPPAHQLPPAPSEVKGYSFSDASYTVGNTSTIHQLSNVQNCGLLSCDGE